MKSVAVPIAALAALVPFVAAQSSAYGQCQSLCHSTTTSNLLIFVGRRWNGLVWRHHLCFGLHLHIQQPL
jgi:hypothetical protein